MAESTSKAKRRCIFWRTEDYDDECILKHVRQANPHAQMPIITGLLNQKLPPSRQRTVDSVSSKWKKLISKKPKNGSFAPSSSNEETDELLLSQIDNYTSLLECGITYQEQWVAADLVPTGTDQMLWVNGHSASIAEIHKEMAAMATKAACGVFFCPE